MSDQARALWWDTEEPLRGLQDKSGNLPYTNEPRGYRGIESKQALDRLRLLMGEGKQRQVYVLSNVPLNVTVDCGWSWKQYQKSLGILRTCSWAVPKNTKDLMALIPDISERAARDWLYELKTAENLIINTIRESADFYISQRVSFSE